MFDLLKNSGENVNLKHYTHSDAKFEDGDWWYYSPSGYRQRVSTHAAKNKNRMYVNGKYIPSSHPLHKPGRYKSLDDAWSHNKIESVNQGEVYVIVNDAWKDWVKVGKAVSSDDRLNGYQTSSPFRDYKVVATMPVEDRHSKEKEMHKIFEHFAEERRGEWFKISRVTAIKLFNYQIKEMQDAA
jgi:hypothetical protein